MNFKTTTTTLSSLRRAALASLLLAAGASAQAQLRITEVAPWSSGSSPVAADWFELTNTGASAISLTGWKMDDSSASFASAAAMSGITTIAAGESVIFIEGSNTATLASAFRSAWFGASAPAGLQIGSYSGSGVGLSTDGDGIAIFNAAGVLQARVSFGVSDGSSPFQTFDNAQGLDGTTISLLSSIGANGAALASDGVEIGSPGVISAVPEPASGALLLGGLGLVVGFIARQRKAA